MVFPVSEACAGMWQGGLNLQEQLLRLQPSITPLTDLLHDAEYYLHQNQDLDKDRNQNQDQVQNQDINLDQGQDLDKG